MKTCFIYALCEPGTRTIRYIGKADCPRKRFNHHMCVSIETRTHLGNWLKSLESKSQRPELVILREVPTAQWQMAEERYIRLARGCGIALVNHSDGGDGAQGVKLSAEARAKISASKLGKPRSPETIAKMRASKLGSTQTPESNLKRSLALRGRKLSAAHVAKMSAANKGRSPCAATLAASKTPEARAKMSASRKGMVFTPEHRANISAAKQGEGRGRKAPGASSSFRGVSWNGQCNKWQSRIRLANGKQKYLGLFVDEVSAARAFDEAILLFSVPTPPNFPAL